MHYSSSIEENNHIYRIFIYRVRVQVQQQHMAITVIYEDTPKTRANSSTCTWLLENKRTRGV